MLNASIVRLMQIAGISSCQGYMRKFWMPSWAREPQEHLGSGMPRPM